MAINDSNQSQPKPEDIRLAIELNRFSETGDSAGLRNESLFNALESYKQAAQLKKNESADPGLWNSIDKQISANRNETGKTASIFSIQSLYLKVAAAILVLVMISMLFLFIPQSEPEYLAVTESEKAELVLDDGSVVTLRPYSSLRIEEKSETQVTYTIEGEGFFDVVSDESRTFSVLADGGRVDVLGTRFSVSNWSSSIRVFLEEGSVRLTDTERNESVILEPGEYSELSDSGLTRPQEGDEMVFTGWMQRIISLEQRPVSDIAAELSHHYNIELIIPEEAAGESLSGSLQLGELEDVLDDLGLSLGGRFIQTGDRSYRFTSNSQD
ncbi:MAG: FecR domain-containing protein [Balneolaceae bacterium]|nr:FecR domain-containing protein [Balneolaceae bacterium]